MSKSTLETLTRQYNLVSKWRQIHWQGGEPSLAGLGFFRYAQALQLPGTRNQFQTNGTRIDATWAKFFAQHDWHVAISWDGHFNGARGREDHIDDAIEALRKHGVRYSVSCVVSRDNIGHPSRTLEHLAMRTDEVQFIPAKAKSPEQRPGGPGPTGPEFKVFLERVWGAVVNYPQMSVRNFDAAHGAWMGQPLTCEVGPGCGYAVVKPDGGVWPCDFFSDSPEWRLGNIHDRELRQIMGGVRMDQFRLLKAIPHAVCEKCSVVKGCGRGCPRDRWLANGDYEDITPMCASARYTAEVTRPGLAP